MITQEELEVLTDSLSDREIADTFKVTKQSVKNWRKKFGIQSFSQKTGLVRRGGKSITRSESALIDVETSIKQGTFSLGKTYKPVKRDGYVTFFDLIDSPSKAYFLGIIATDGYVSKNGKTVSIALQERDSKLLNDFIDISGWNTTVRKKKHKTPQAVISLCSKHTVSTLATWGITPNKSLTLEIKRIIPVEFESDFVRGVWDGDGYIGKVQFALVSGSSIFIAQVREIIYKNTGINLTLCRPKNRNSLVLSGNRNSKKVLQWIYSNPYPVLERKAIQFSRFWN